MNNNNNCELEHPVKSLERAIDIIFCLGEGVGRVTDISHRLKINSATVHRLLKTYELKGLVVQDPVSRCYYFGPSIFKLASNFALSHKILTMCAFEEMKRLCELSEETVVLSIQLGPQRFNLQQIEGNHDFRYQPGQWTLRPLYAGAPGKILLSQLEDDELGLILDNISLFPITPKTITDKATLIEEIKKSRQQGYAVTFGELSIGMAISVPVSSYVQPVALSLIGIEARMVPHIPRLVKELKKSSIQISDNLQGFAQAPGKPELVSSHK